VVIQRVSTFTYMNEPFFTTMYTKKVLVTGFFVGRSLGSLQAGHSTL